MLPFLEPKKAVSIIVAKRGKDSVEVAPEKEMGEGVDPGLKEAAEDILRAIDRKSPIDLAKALHAAYMICESLYEPESDEMMPEDME